MPRPHVRLPLPARLPIPPLAPRQTRHRLPVPMLPVRTDPQPMPAGARLLPKRSSAMSRHLLPLLAVLICAGCSLARPRSMPPMPPPPPAEATLACGPLPPMFATAGEAVAWVEAVSRLFVECDARRRVAVEAWPSR